MFTSQTRYDGVILGIDPGLNITGYGAISLADREVHVIVAGDIRPPRSRPLPERLEFLHCALTELIARQHPQTIVLEMVFTHERYLNTAAKMGHARGIACLAAQQHQIPLIEYPPARIKQALTGRGAASKEQVARMVAQWTGCRDASWSLDATDALALAIAHAHMMRMRNAECGMRNGRNSELRNPNSEFSVGLGIKK